MWKLPTFKICSLNLKTKRNKKPLAEQNLLLEVHDLQIQECALSHWVEKYGMYLQKAQGN